MFIFCPNFFFFLIHLVNHQIILDVTHGRLYKDHPISAWFPWQAVAACVDPFIERY